MPTTGASGKRSATRHPILSIQPAKKKKNLEVGLVEREVAEALLLSIVGSNSPIQNPACETLKELAVPMLSTQGGFVRAEVVLGRTIKS